MMGQHSGNQDRLFYAFNLDAHVPADHLLRGIDRFLDLTDLRSYLAPFYSHTGRPSIDPELMVRMLLVGYCFGIRSERRLCEELQKKSPFMYRASQLDRQICPLKSKCCPNMLHRKIERSPFEPARDVVRALRKTTRYRQSRRDRKKVEVLFAHMKRILRVDRLRLRGRTGAHDEFLLTAIAQNLRRLAITFRPMSMETVPAPA
jgi:hypothetical protein